MMVNLCGDFYSLRGVYFLLLIASMMVFVGLLQLPEMTRDAGESYKSKCVGLALDIVGLSLGVAIMTSIAFHEESIQLFLAGD